MAAPPKAPKGDEATLAWVKDRFRRYYRGANIPMPTRFTRREFGFMLWEAGVVVRHRAFSSAAKLRDFLTRTVPMHVYHSSAYYETPNAPTMEDKGWLGADIVFDLDADHIPSAKDMSYEGMLEAVKKKIIQLHDDFLVNDFGIDESSLRLVFSGGRGYHIHVSDERVWSLASHERRELVDYITGKGLDFGVYYRESVFDTHEFKGTVRGVKKMLVPPKKDAPGWGGKLARGTITLAERLDGLPLDEALKYLASFQEVGGLREARDLYENLFKVRTLEPRSLRGIDRLRQDGNPEVLTDKNRDRFLGVVRRLQEVRLDTSGPVSLEGIRGRAETDEPVTSDIKRLIRMPHSLHGKTGLAVVPLTRDDLDAFLPLRDAVPASWTEDPVRLRLRSGIKIRMRAETFNLKEGLNEVPEHLAVFLACRGLASVAA